MLDPHYYDEQSEQMRKFAADQLSVWPLAGANYRELRNTQVRTIELDGVPLQVIYMPSRAISTLAETDPVSLSSRPCFLCAKHRPVEQRVMGFEGAKGKKYNIQLNPYPILPNHFVIPSIEHIPQSIWHRYVDMLRLAKRRPGFTVIYNGPCAGASAPDHFHFQAVPSGILPMELSIAAGEHQRYLAHVSDARLYEYTAVAHGIFVIRARSSKSMNRMFYRLLDCADIFPGENEPRFNLITFRVGAEYCSVVFMRTATRSGHYYSADEATHLAMSPGCVDMAGTYVTIDRQDFEKLTPELLREVIDGVTISGAEHSRIAERLTRDQRTLEITVAEGPCLEFEVLSDGAGCRKAVCVDGRVEYGGDVYDELYFEAKNPSTMFAEASFVMYTPSSVRYAGALRITACDGVLKAENVIGVEDYVYSLLSHCEACDEGDLAREAVALRSEALNGNFSHVYDGCGALRRPEVRKAVDSTWGVLAN